MVTKRNSNRKRKPKNEKTEVVQETKTNEVNENQVASDKNEVKEDRPAEEADQEASDEEVVADEVFEDCPIAHDQIKAAVDALLAVLEKKGALKKEILFRTNKIHIQITTQRIPNKKKKTVLIPLPHPIYSTSSEVCVFTKNIDKLDSEKSLEYFEDVFRNRVGFVPKIIPYRSLVKDYKAYFQKKRLCNSFDIFFGDKRIMRLLPSNTGTCFYVKNKEPIQIDFERNLKKDFLGKLSSTRWKMSGRGNCSSFPIGHTGLTPEQITENVEACLKQVPKQMIRGWDNVRLIQITTANALALPLYKCEKMSNSVDVKDQEEVDYIRELRKRKHPDDEWLITKVRQKKKRRPEYGDVKTQVAAE